MRRTALSSLFLMLAACHEPRPPAPTAAEEERLNDADRMLGDMERNEQGPADRSTGP